jgi:DNA-binding response OmpR family regulator
MSTLLLVDADPLSLRVLDVSLRKAGYDVVTATDAADALAKLRGVPDLLLTDTRLREGDGFALAKTLRERDGAADLPVIFLSRAESVEERERAQAMAVEDVVVKPVFVRELLARVQLLLARRVQVSVEAGRSTGTTSELALVDLLQSLEASHTTGVVHLEHGAESAHIYVRDGNVVDAELGRLRGSDVVVLALGWEAATFRVEPRDVDNDDLIECTTHALLMRALDRLDGRTPPPEPVVASEPIVPPAPKPEPVEAALEPQADSVAREQSIPSTAPWTREAVSSEAPPPPADLHAAGVPGASSRRNRRIASVTAAAGAALLVVMGLSSMHARHVREAEEARVDVPVATAAAAPAQPAQPPSAPPAGLVATPAEPSEPGAAPASTDAIPAPGTDAMGATAAVASSTPTVDPRERALDVKTQMHSRSPLVRDAESALLKGETAKATSLAQQAVAFNPNDADGWLTLAAARKASGDVSGAQGAYAQCIAKGHTVGVMSCRALAVQSH